MNHCDCCVTVERRHAGFSETSRRRFNLVFIVRHDRHDCSSREARRRDHRRLGGPSESPDVDSEFVAGMSRQRVFRRQGLGNLPGKVLAETALAIDRGQFRLLGHGGGDELAAFAFEVGKLGVALRTHRHVLPRGHRQRPGGQPRHACDKDRRPRAVGRGDRHHQARSRYQSVIRSQDSGA